MYFFLDFGTGDVKKCSHEKVQFDSALGHQGVLAASLKCTHIREKDKRRTGEVISFRVEYLASARRNNTYFCGCTPTTESLCFSSFNDVPSKAPKIAIWNTTVPGNNNSTARGNSNMKMLRQIRDEFAFPGNIPWKDFRKELAVLLRNLLVSCFFYEDETRSCVACVRDYAVVVQSEGQDRPSVANEVLLIAKTTGSISFVQYHTFKRNRFPVGYLAGVLDGQGIPETHMLVYRTYSAGMRLLAANEMLGFLLYLILNYNMLLRNLLPSKASATELARILTAFMGANSAGVGTLRSCSGTVLTLETLGIVAAILLLLIFLLMCSLSIMKSPEPPLTLVSRGDALESWHWVLKSLQSERAGSGMPWSSRHTDEVIILERAPELKLKITNRENELSACTCTTSEIKSMP